MYIQASFYTDNVQLREILVALLESEGFDGFEETEDALLAFIAKDVFDRSLVERLADENNIRVEVAELEKQNWNETWESNFQQVIVEGFVTVRADFHPPAHDTPYEIIITPKMSFGTGHHATTFLMMKLMAGLSLSGKQVLDLGTGTGILAILAEKLGAADIVAADNDEWAYENAKENIERNFCHHVSLILGTLDNVPQKTYDVILANINRHILIAYMQSLAQLLKKEGTLLLSGILREDKEQVLACASDNRLRLAIAKEKDNWVALQLNTDI